ncbi:MAG: DUF5683 domain-containing protein [candidate division KSB1 bacterium]|nr:DUF5683 domain-containing protein [candidate division KSB1 bacterium]
MRFVKTYIVLLFVWIVFVSHGWAQQAGAEVLQTKGEVLKKEVDTLAVRTKKDRSPTGAMLRSLAFPGWGQWYNGKKFKALIAFGAESALLANAIYLNQKVVASTGWEEREFYINNRNLSVWWLLGTILLSMADAYVDAQLANFDESPDLSLRFKTEGYFVATTVDSKYWVTLSFRF